jgi:hypothetical protein
MDVLIHYSRNGFSLQVDFKTLGSFSFQFFDRFTRFGAVT